MTPEIRAAAYWKIGLRILPILFITYFVNFLDRVNVSFAKLSMLSSLQMDEKAYGFAVGLFFWGYFLFEVPSNLMLYRFGARRWLALLAVLWGILTVLTAFVTALWQLSVLRFLLGTAECGFFPGIILYLTWWYPKALRVRIMAGFISAIPISGIFGGPLSGGIMKLSNGWLGLENWRWLFLIEAAPCFLVALWIFKGLIDRPGMAPWLDASERDAIESELAREERERAEQGSSQHASQAFTNPVVWQLCALYFCQMMGLYGISFWLPKIIKNLGWKDDFQIGLVSAIPWLCAVVIMFLLGTLADRSGDRRYYAIVAALLGSFGFFASSYFDNSCLRLGCLALAASGVMGLMAISWSFPAALLSAQAAAAGIALINSFGNLGGFFSPTLVGYITPPSGSLSNGMSLTGGFMLLAAFLLFIFRSLQPEQKVMAAAKMEAAS